MALNTWSARELQPLLGYSQWLRFEDAINRAMISCGQSGNKPDYHFAGAGKMVELGSGSARNVDDHQIKTCMMVKARLILSHVNDIILQSDYGRLNS